MERDKPIVNTGLRGITVASTRISDVQGKAGKLIYRGYRITDLAEHACYEEIAHLLLMEKLPDAEEMARFHHSLAAERAVPDGLMDTLKTIPGSAHPMDVMQAAAAMLAHYDPDIADSSREAFQKMAVRAVARFPTVLAAWSRIRNGNDPIAPDPELGHAANFLYMTHGTKPDSDLVHYLDVCLVLHAEHSFNASTFSARQVASTRAHMYAAISAAVGSLSGPLHGGANERVMRMLEEIGEPENVDRYVEEVLNAGEKIMGLGHTVYQVDDPRAHILAPMSRDMGERIGEPKWYEISRKLEKKAKAAFRERKGTDIYVNVDFYSASLYHAMGFPTDLFTPLFAVARVAGWTAHVLEERFAEAAPKPMLYRPSSEYIGDYCGPEECVFVPMEER